MTNLGEQRIFASPGGLDILGEWTKIEAQWP